MSGSIRGRGVLRKLKLLNSHSLLIIGLGLPPPRQTELSIGPPTIKIQASLLFEKQHDLIWFEKGNL